MTDAPLKPCPALYDALLAARDYVWDASKGHLVPADPYAGDITDMAKGDLARIEAAIAAHATRPDPAPTGEVTQDVSQADRDATAAYLERLPGAGRRTLANECRSGVRDDEDLVQAFRDHRLRSTAPLEAENARLREALEEIRDAAWPDMDAASGVSRIKLRARLALSPDGDASEGGGL